MTKNKALNSGIWFTVSNFFTKAVGFLTTPIFTRMLTKSEFGDFSNIQTWLMILAYITSLNLEGSLIRATHEHKKDLDSYVFSMITLSAISTAFWWLLVSLFFERFNTLLAIDRTYINCMFLYLLFSPAVNLFQNVERFKYKYKWTVLISVAVSVGASLGSAILVYFMSNKLTGRVLGYIAPTIIIGLCVIIYYFYKHATIKIDYWKYALPIVLPYIPHLLSMCLLNNMDRVMIRNICGVESVALYSLAYTCGMIITMLVSSVNSAYAPWLAEKLNVGDYDVIRKYTIPYICFFSFFSLGCVLITPEVLMMLGGKTYMEAKYVMPPVAAGCLLQFTYCMYVNVEQYEKRTGGMAVASVLAALVNYVLNYIFIPKFGYIAAAYTTYAGYFSLLIIHMFLVKRIEMSKVYNNVVIFMVSVGTSVLIFLTNFLLDKTIVRYVVILVYVAIFMVLLAKNYKKVRGVI